MSSIPNLAKKVKKIASMHFLSLKLLLNGRGFSKFKKQYCLKGEMGSGGFGVVYRAVRIADNLPVAVKFIERRHLNDERVPMEICMLARCSKIGGVIRLLDWFNMPEGFLIIMERPSPCIDLFDFIHNQQMLDENISHTIVECAERKVLHRDIKDENVIIDLISGETRLIDFGAATLLKKTRYNDFQGTRLYCPPEWFLHSLYLGREATVWSMGILLYNMLNGRLPFQNEKDICTAHLLGPLPFFTNLSTEARDLIEKCLTFDPFSRISLEDLLHHPWMQMNSELCSWLQLTASSSSSLNSSASDSENDDGLQDEEYGEGKTNIEKHSINQRRPISTGNSRRMEKLIIKTNKCQQQYLEARPKNKNNNKSPEKVTDELAVIKKISRNESGLESDASARLNSSNEHKQSEKYSTEEEILTYSSSRDQYFKKTIGENALEVLQRQIFHDSQTEQTDSTISSMKNYQQKSKTSLVVRRNAKNSILHSVRVISFEGIIYDIEVDAEIDDQYVRPNLQQFKLRNNGSFDSGTSSALHSPKIIPNAIYSFDE